MIAKTPIDKQSRISRFARVLASPFLFGYEAVKADGRRRVPLRGLRSEDAELNSSERRSLLATSRDQLRNFPVAGWMLRKHLDYISTFEFQAKTGDVGLDSELEKFVEEWSRRGHFDMSGRYSRQAFIRQAEACRTIDGDVMIHRHYSGRVAAIEGDRIRTPHLQGKQNASDYVHGIRTNAAGVPLAYALHNRTRTGDSFQYVRDIPARYIFHHGYFSRFDQIRGISPFAPAINALQDVHESITYALAKAKVTQMFALATYRSSDEYDAIGEVDSDRGDSELMPGVAVHLDLNEEEKAEFLESRHPSTEFQSFYSLMVAMALKSLDIPYSFWDESHTNFSGNRHAWILYNQSAKRKREANRELLNTLLVWRLQRAVATGEITLPQNKTISGLAWRWVDTGVPWIDPLKEIAATVKAIEAGLTSVPLACIERGDDAYQILEDQAKYLAARKKAIGEFEENVND